MSQKTVTPETVTLHESTFSDMSQKIDEANGIIRDVKVLGIESKNGYTYPLAAQRKAVSLFEGAEVNIDHSPREAALKSRVMIEGWGVIRNPRVKDDGTYGDLHYLKTHQETERNLERIRKGFRVGLSPVSEVILKSPRGGKPYVEEIVNVVSVDFVRRPATTTNLFESERQPMLVKAKDLAAKATKEHVRLLLESAADTIEFESTGDEQNDVRLATGLVLESQVIEKKEEKKEAPAVDTNALQEQTSLVKSLAVSVQYLMESEKAREKDRQISTVLESHGLVFSDLDPERQKLLREAKDLETMKLMVNTWPPIVRHGNRKVFQESHKQTTNRQPAKSFQELYERTGVA